MGTTIDNIRRIQGGGTASEIEGEVEHRLPGDRYDLGSERDEALPLVKSGSTGVASAVEVMRRQQLIERERKLHDRLTRFARGYSRDWDVALVPGDRLAYDPARKRMSYPIQRMMEQTDTQNLADLINALAPAKYSLVPPASQLSENPSFALLWKAVDTIRVRNIAAARHPNVTKMLRSRNEDLAEGTSLGLKSKEFIDTILRSWATGVRPREEELDPIVHQALESTREAIEEATRLPPKVDLRFGDPDEKTIRHEAERSFSILRDHVWPAVEALLREDVEQKQNENSSSNDKAQDSSSKAEGDTGKSDPEGQPGKTKSDSSSGKTSKDATQPDGDDSREAKGDEQSSGKSKGEQSTGAKKEERPDELDSGRDRPGERQPDPKPSAQRGEGESCDPKDRKSDAELENRREQDGGGVERQDDRAKQGEQKPDEQKQGELPADPLKAGEEGEARERAKQEIRELMAHAAEKLDASAAERAPIPDPEKKGEQGAGEEEKSGPPQPKDQGTGANASGAQPGANTPKPSSGAGKSSSTTGATSTADSAAQAAKRSWSEVKKSNHKVIHDMIVQFATHFMREGVPELVGHFSEGEIWDMQRGLENRWRAQATGEHDDREYLQEEDPIESYDEVILVVDTSKSMEEGGKEDAATDALVAFHETFRTLGVRHAIVEFAGSPNVLLEMGKTPQTPKERDAILSGLRLKDTGTDDYSALLRAKKLFSGNATRKLIVFITDGKGSNLQRRAVEHAEDFEGIRCLGMHIGRGENAVADSYRHSTSQENVRLVPRAMSDFLLANW